MLGGSILNHDLLIYKILIEFSMLCLMLLKLY